jgi:hypothetical protein
LAALWFLLWLAPSGWWLPRPEPANDRQLYLALLGPAWLAGRWAASLLAAGGWRRVASAAAAAGLVGTLGATTFARNRVYADEVRFWEDVVRKSPGSPRAHNNLGFALAARCRILEAEANLVRAMELDPGYVRAEVNLALLREGAPLAPGRPPCPRPAGGRPRPDAPP